VDVAKTGVENGATDREREEERKRPEIAQEFGCTSRIPACIYSRHKHLSQAPTGPEPCLRGKRRNHPEATGGPLWSRYARVSRYINFRERRLSRVSVALYAPEITIRSFPLSIALLALWRTAVGSHALVTTSCNRYREQTTFHAVASERFRPPCNIAESAVDSNKFEASLIEAPNDNDNTIWRIVYLLFTRAREN